MSQSVSACNAEFRSGHGVGRAKKTQKNKRQATGIGGYMTGHKYHNRKIIVDGEIFDSVKESSRYLQLKSLEKIKAISNLKRQVKYTIIPAQKDENGKTIERQCVYIADFVYQQNGKTVVEDVKGYRGGCAYSVFTIKRKLMLYKYGIRVKEV